MPSHPKLPRGGDALHSSQFSSVESLPTPKDRGLDSLTGDLVVLLGGGIVNPFGPTLQLIAATGPWQVGVELPIIRAVLNPFSQQIQQVGVLALRDLFSPDDTLAAVLPERPGGCPTALLVSPFIIRKPENIVASVASYLANCDHGATTLAGVNRFPGDPRARVKHDIDESMRIMLAQHKGQNAEWPKDRKLTIDEATELARIQLQHDHWLAEWRSFVACWTEAIEHQQRTGIARTELPFATIETMVNSAVDMSYAALANTFPGWGTSPPDAPVNWP